MINKIMLSKKNLLFIPFDRVLLYMMSSKTDVENVISANLIQYHILSKNNIFESVITIRKECY